MEKAKDFLESSVHVIKKRVASPKSKQDTFFFYFQGKKGTFVFIFKDKRAHFFHAVLMMMHKTPKIGIDHTRISLN